MMNLPRIFKKKLRLLVVCTFLFPTLTSAQVVQTFREWDEGVQRLVNEKRAALTPLQQRYDSVRETHRSNPLREEHERFRIYGDLRPIFDDTVRSLRVLFGMEEVQETGWRIKQEYITNLAQASDGEQEDHTYYGGRGELLRHSNLVESKWVVGSKSIGGLMAVPTLPDYLFPVEPHLIFAHCSPFQRHGRTLACALLNDMLTILPRATMPDEIRWGPLEMNETTFTVLPEGVSFQEPVFKVFSPEEITPIFPQEALTLIQAGIRAVRTTQQTEKQVEEKLQRARASAEEAKKQTGRYLEEFRQAYSTGRCLLDEQPATYACLAHSFSPLPSEAKILSVDFRTRFMTDVRISLQTVVDVYGSLQSRIDRMNTLQAEVDRQGSVIQPLTDDLVQKLSRRPVVQLTVAPSIPQGDIMSSMWEDDIKRSESKTDNKMRESSILEDSFDFEEAAAFDELSSVGGSIGGSNLRSGSS